MFAETSQIIAKVDFSLNWRKNLPFVKEMEFEENFLNWDNNFVLALRHIVVHLLEKKNVKSSLREVIAKLVQNYQGIGKIIEVMNKKFA